MVITGHLRHSAAPAPCNQRDDSLSSSAFDSLYSFRDEEDAAVALDVIITFVVKQVDLAHFFILPPSLSVSRDPFQTISREMTNQS